MHKPTTTPQTAEALQLQLRAAGYQPGAPRHVTAVSQAIDAQACGRLRCPGCHRRSCAYRPFTDGRGYRVVACCQACGHAVEM
jgi:hypothetical protein